jgi:hypothetical protein
MCFANCNDIIFNKNMQNEPVCFAHFCEILASYEKNFSIRLPQNKPICFV